MRRISSCLGAEVRESRWPHLLNARTFQTMKRQAEQGAPQTSQVWKGGAQTFFVKVSPASLAVPSRSSR